MTVADLKTINVCFLYILIKFLAKICILNATLDDIKRNRVEVDEQEFHSVGDLIKKKNISASVYGVSSSYV